MNRVIVYAMMALMGVTAGCGKAHKSSDNPVATNAIREATVRLQWFDTAQFAGMYVAQDKGFYKDAGLKVDLRPGGPDLNAITLVTAGSDTFGVWTADHILIAQSKGVPITMVAAIYREDPNVLMVKADSPIQSPADFRGKRITTVAGRSTEVVLRALLAGAGIAENDVTIEPFPFNIQSFLEGKVDVSAAYSYDHPYQAEKAGQAVRIIRPTDHGVRFYSDVIFARTDLVKRDPELVQKFISATLQGWTLALNDRDAALASTLNHGKGLDRESQMYMLEHSAPLIRAEDPDHLGRISAQSLTNMVQILKSQNLIPASFTLGSAAYDNSFVDAFYK